MAMGLSAGAIGLIGAVAPTVIGGLMGGKGSSGPQQQTSSKQELDPRMQQLLYDGNYDGKGLLGDVERLRKQQMGQGGLNPMQNAGLEMQRMALMDPRYTQGYDQMRNQGASLMSQPVAGNPFSNGYQGGTNFTPNRPAGQNAPPVPNLGMGTQQQTAPAPAYAPIQSAPTPAPMAAPESKPMDKTSLQQYLDELLAQREQVALMSQPANYGDGR